MDDLRNELRGHIADAGWNASDNLFDRIRTAAFNEARAKAGRIIRENVIGYRGGDNVFMKRNRGDVNGLLYAEAIEKMEPEG